MKRSNLLIITDYYLPGYRGGGPIQSIKNLVSILDQSIDSLILTRNHDHSENKKPYDSVEHDRITLLNGQKVFYSSSLSFKTILRVLKVSKPNKIYLNSFFSTLAIKILILNKFLKTKYSIILAPRGELSRGALGIKKFKKILYLSLSKNFLIDPSIIFHSTSLSESTEIQAIFPSNKVIEIPNLTSRYFSSKRNLIKTKGSVRLVFLSRISPKKNLEFALTCLNEIKFNFNKIIFDIYGVEEDLAYSQFLREKIISMPCNIEVRLLGEIPHDNVMKILEQYHVFFMPTKGENYGHAIVESMQAGIIPLISDLTPWDFSNSDFGYSIGLNKKDQFIKALEELVNLDNKSFIKRSNSVKSYISNYIKKESSVKKYNELFKS